MVGPGPFPPQPPDPQFPARAVPGQPPPPPPREPFPPVTSIPDTWGPVVDPALDAGLVGLVSRPARLRAAATTQWSVTSLLHATAPRRHTPGPDVAFLDESPLTVTAAHLPLDSLPDAPPGVDLLSRLRMVHRKLLPEFARQPRSASWATAGGHDAVLDLFDAPARGPAHQRLQPRRPPSATTPGCWSSAGAGPTAARSSGASPCRWATWHGRTTPASSGAALPGWTLREQLPGDDGDDPGPGRVVPASRLGAARVDGGGVRPGAVPPRPPVTRRARGPGARPGRRLDEPASTGSRRAAAAR